MTCPFFDFYLLAQVKLVKNARRAMSAIMSGLMRSQGWTLHFITFYFIEIALY